ncbi:MAG: Alpha/Beta hydrolase protein [Monoraphidium minutum]|nr:MAG: Alpha/Beta hydrolase protein [Monoraphidium minutum]
MLPGVGARVLHAAGAMATSPRAEEPEPASRKLGKHGHSSQSRSSWASFDSLADLTIPLSPVEAAERALEKAVLLLSLALRLWSYLGLGYKWLLQVYRLCLYAMLLLPGFAQMVFYYFLSPRVQRNIPYGRKPRQVLDLYVPKAAGQDGQLAPVVVFVTGGAWTIGYKAWGAILGRRLCEAGVMVACLDYRNFPQGDALQMVEDVNTGIAWVTRRVERYGGDPEAVHLVGQSAGGQLALLALLNQAAQAATGEAVLGAAPVWHPLDVKAFVGVSGAYDLEGLAEHLHRRGLYRSLLDTIMSVEGAVAYGVLSPLAYARALAKDDPGVGRFLPPALLLHGTADKSVPAAGSVLMHDALERLEVPVSYRLFEGKTHTDFLLEDAFRGGKDDLTDAILELVTGRPHAGRHRTMCPRPLVWLASRVCPF